MNPEDIYEHVGPSVDGPMPLVIAIEGWLEASDTVIRVRDAIVHQADLTTLVRFDTDRLLDQRGRRPLITVVDGVIQNLEWPELELALGTDQDGKPFLLLHGPEPDFGWRPFGKAVASIVSSIGVTAACSINAYPAPAPHTRPMRISFNASDAELLTGRVFTSGLINVPAGVHWAAIAEELLPFGIPNYGLYAQVPYYLSAQDWPQASIAMLTALSDVAGLSFTTDRLDCLVDDAVAAVEAMFDESPSLSDVVTRLEQRYDELLKLEDETLPNGDELEEELQQYLRDMDDSG